LNTRRDVIQTIGAGIATIGAVSSTFVSGEAMAAPSGTEDAGTRVATTASGAINSRPFGFEYFIGIVGNPSSPEIEWSDDELRKIRDLGVNMLQLSIAWGNKPADEVLNLEDMDAVQQKKFAYRTAQARKMGFRTIAQFGVPRMLNYEPVRPACIMSPEIRRKYVQLLGAFLEQYPNTADIHLYTFDQQAWLCSEYGPCPRCSGLPLHERLPGFLNELSATLQQHRPDGTLWWKPWELTKGQTQAVLERVNAAHFGLILNSSTSNEVYPFNDRSFKSDLGVKRLVNMARERRIPVIGEFDHTLYKGLYLIADFFPRLVYEQLQAWKEMEGVIGVKEYFGFAPSQFSVNAAMLSACMKSPQAPLDQLLREIAKPYGERAAPLMIQAWEYVTQGAETFPWDTTYMIGAMGLDKDNDGSHGWEPKTIPNGNWDTPIWRSNRRANYMLTQDYKADPWLFEDAGLRLEDSAALHFRAVALFDQALSTATSGSADIQMQRDAVLATARALRGTSLHFLETLSAHSARLVGYDEAQFDKVRGRLDDLLVKDVQNQRGAGDVTDKLAAFRKDPRAWLASNLKPRTYESVCSIDWSKYVPFQGA
jgi:hypothetical protein